MKEAYVLVMCCFAYSCFNFQIQDFICELIMVGGLLRFFGYEGNIKILGSCVFYIFEDFFWSGTKILTLEI